jgi:uncharacterized membrane protein YebE (DUF533 family)
MRAESILDALVGAKARPPGERRPGDDERGPGFLEEALSAFGLGGPRREESRREFRGDEERPGALRQGVGDTRSMLGDWITGAKEAMGRNPTLTAGGLAAAAGMLLSGRGRGLLGSVAGIGGVGLIGALAYNAWRKYQERKAGGEDIDRDALNPATATDRDAELFARVMVAAIAADGHIDAIERARIASGLREAGLDADGTKWLDREFAKPASVEDLARAAATPEKALQVYSAARLVIEPDTPEERQFLDRLAGALKLDPALRNEVDGGAATLKTGG